MCNFGMVLFGLNAFQQWSISALATVIRHSVYGLNLYSFSYLFNEVHH